VENIYFLFWGKYNFYMAETPDKKWITKFLKKQPPQERNIICQLAWREMNHIENPRPLTAFRTSKLKERILRI